MREIRFRGFSVRENKFVYGDFFKKGWGLKNGISAQGEPGVWDIKDGTIGQYTGLKDIEGNKIFEGDIVEWKDVTGYEDGAGCIEWEPSHAGWFVVNTDIFDTVYDFDNCLRIIGNKFDNPQLLEGMK